MENKTKDLATTSKNEIEVVKQNVYNGMSLSTFTEKTIEVLNSPIDSDDIEIRPDKIIFLPEIKYRRILSKAFGQGRWALMPMGKPQIEGKYIFWQFSLYCEGKFISTAIGEQEYTINGNMSFATASESAKSNSMMRCCKDLSIASDLWNPTFINNWIEKNAVGVWCIHQKTNRKKQLWFKKDKIRIAYPWKANDNNFNQQNQNQNRQQKQQPPKKEEPKIAFNMVISKGEHKGKKFFELPMKYISDIYQSTTHKPTLKFINEEILQKVDNTKLTEETQTMQLFKFMETYPKEI